MVSEHPIFEKYSYTDGYFAKVTTNIPARWEEKTLYRVYHFDEINRDEGFILLKDASRNIMLQVPVSGGYTSISVDGSQSWLPFYQVWQE